MSTIATNEGPSPFARALAGMNPEERARAHRLRDVFNVREEDAIWELCGIVQGLAIDLEDTQSRCAVAIEQALKDELGAKRLEVPAAALASPAPPRLFHLVAFVTLLVAWSILVGSTVFALGTLVKYGHVQWVPHSTRSANAFQYAATAILNAPVGGFFAIVGLLSGGFVALAFSPFPRSQSH